MIGQTVGHYRVLEKLGEGGMGEVYLAQDTSLGRSVALKFLPASLADDEIAQKRFLREARSAAILDHPYICNVFEVAQTDEGIDFIAMEYLEGETLQRRLERGPLALKEALKLGSELAEALESAHSKGIVHRDLKPANIMLTPAGHAKVMDFGLAKKLVGEDGREQDISSALTREGATLGTLSYMSPEQLRGQPVDCRSDIFSLGIVLYEMLGGVHPFRKAQAPETTGAILKDDPAPLARYVTELPELLRHTVEKMLAKAPADRYQSVHEVLTNLTQLREESGKARTDPRGTGRAVPIWFWVGLSTLAGLVVGMALLWIFGFELASPTDPAPVVRFSIRMPEGERLASGGSRHFRHAVAISPDGRWITYVSYSGEANEPDGDPVINLRRLDQTEVRRIPGFNPFFSPDGLQLGFVEVDSQDRPWIKRTELEGSRVETVTLMEGADDWGGYGCVWLPDETIAFAPGDFGLRVVPAVGGEVRQFTELDQDRGEISHRLPSVLTDGRTILYTVVRSQRPKWGGEAQIVAYRLDTGVKKVLIEQGFDGRYVESGHLIFAREGRLMAVQFDIKRLEVKGDPVPVLDGVTHSIQIGHSGCDCGAAQYAVSREGMLAFGPGSFGPEPGHQPVLVDREGREEALNVPPGQWGSPRIAVDGRHILLLTIYPPSAIYLYDLVRKTLRRQTFSDSGGFVIWGPGEDEFSYDSDSERNQGIYLKSIDSGTGPGEQLVATEAGEWPGSWAPGGQSLAYVRDNDIWILDRLGEPRPFLETTFWEHSPEFSPDGRWLAYATDQTGKVEVYVRPFPGPGKPVQISTDGGDEPCWSLDGRELFYRLPSIDSSRYYSVQLEVDEKSVRPALPKPILEGSYLPSWPVRRYDIGPDGRFVLIKRDPNQVSGIREAMSPTRIELVQNWFEELRARVPVE